MPFDQQLPLAQHLLAWRPARRPRSAHRRRDRADVVVQLAAQDAEIASERVEIRVPIRRRFLQTPLDNGDDPRIEAGRLIA
jgi:hypothetical protein